MGGSIMTVKDLIIALEKFPLDYEVKFYEQGGVFCSNINKIYRSTYDKKYDRNVVTLGN